MDQTNKNRNPSSLVYLIFEWYVDAVVHRVLFFLFKTNGKKWHMDEKDFRHYYGNISKVPFWKLLDYSITVFNN